MTVQANENNDGISLKSIVDGAGKILSDTGDKISETGKNIYETEVPPEKISKAVSGIGGLIGTVFVFIFRIFATILICAGILQLFVMIYTFFKYFFFNKTKKDWDDISKENYVGKVETIREIIFGLSALSFFISWVYYDKFPLFQFIQF